MIRVDCWELHQQDVWILEFGSFWCYQFLRSFSGTRGHLWEFCILHIPRSVCFVYLLSVALHQKVGQELLYFNSSELDRELAVLVYVRLLWFQSRIFREFFDTSWNLNEYGSSFATHSFTFRRFFFTEVSVFLSHSFCLLGWRGIFLHQWLLRKVLSDQLVLLECLPRFWDASDP